MSMWKAYGFPVRTIYKWLIFHVDVNGYPLGIQKQKHPNNIIVLSQNIKDSVYHFYIWVSQNTVSNPGSLTRGYDSWV